MPNNNAKLPEPRASKTLVSMLCRTFGHSSYQNCPVHWVGKRSGKRQRCAKLQINVSGIMAPEMVNKSVSMLL
ncbi:Uncharacterised protein [Vibrio cholerae]|nr:Uncharacterised protein [Vibrio cholerae]CSC89121.1 Uncharacterised protein [Vibrio cholerae]CSD24442.1 Uncharacterised protein [Vibrio cholerae]